MTDKDRAWIEELRRTKTEGHIGFGCRQMRRLLAILDEAVADAERLDREADSLATRLAASPASCPADSFCVGKVRPGCAELDDAAKCLKCYREEARRAVENPR